jgi:hypothetical protein
VSKQRARLSDKNSSSSGIRRPAASRRRAPKATPAAAAAERASAGMGTEAKEPTDWLFGDSLLGPAPRPY